MKLPKIIIAFLVACGFAGAAFAQTTIPISGLPQAAMPPNGSEYLAGVQDGVTRKFKLSTMPVLGDVYWTQNGTGAVQRTVASRLKDEVFVTDFGVDQTGLTGASAKINQAVTAGRRVFFPCGTYLIDAPIFLPSNTTIEGSGPCTVLKTSSTLAADTSTEFGSLRHVFTNNNYATGNTDIYIHDLAIDDTSGPSSGVSIHAIAMFKVTRSGVWNVSITSTSGKRLGDGVAYVSSKEYFVRNNKIYGTINACIDQWGGSTDFEISGNLCDGLNIANYGILVSGFNTNKTAATTQRGAIHGNVVKNFPGAGIWLQGGWNGVSGGGATYGLVKKIEVVGNNVSGVNGYHGIYLSDASNNAIASNTMENIGGIGIVITSESAGSATGNVVSSNSIVSCYTAATGNACIQLTPYAHFNTLADNAVIGTAHPYAIVINGGATGNIIRGGYMAAGTIGVVSDGGTGTQIQIGNAFTTPPTFSTLTGYVKGNGGSAATAASTIPTTDLTGTLQAAQEPAHTGDVTNSAGSLAMTLATVNSNVGTYGSATKASQVTVNAKGLVTAASEATVTPAVGSITGLGTGVATALGNATNASGGLLGYGSSIGLHADLSEGAYRVVNLNLNATGDTAVPITMPSGATRYVLFAIRVSHSTGNLPNGTGTLGAYTGAGRTGVTLASQQALNTLITSQADATAGNAGSMTIAVGGTQSFTATTLYLNVQTAQGATATIDVALVLRFF